MASTEKSLLARIQRLEDIHEINHIMHLRAYYHSAGRHDLEIDELWSKDDGIVFEPEDWGAWIGQKSVRASYVEGNPFPNTTKGLLIEHLVTTPVIEVAGDGQTAKGIFISPGHETFPVEDKLPIAHWSWLRYAVDFKKEEGKWKIWHLHILTTFRTPYDQDWAATGIKKPEWLPEDGAVLPGIPKPDRGISFNQPYHPNKAPAFQPVPPEPYSTWSETWSSVEPYKYKEKS